MNNVGYNNRSSVGVNLCQSPQDNGVPLAFINSKSVANFERGCNCVHLELNEVFGQAG